MATVAKRWTLDKLHALPEDGNKYEVGSRGVVHDVGAYGDARDWRD